MKHSRPFKKFLIAALLLLFIAIFCTCTKTKSHIKTITSARQLTKITARAKDRLLMIDFFDEGCMSCYMLLAQLEGIAVEQKDKVTIYKIDAAKNPEIAKTFNVTKRPYVVFVKNKKGVHALAGLQPKETFVDAINRFAN